MGSIWFRQGRKKTESTPGMSANLVTKRGQRTKANDNVEAAPALMAA